MRLVALFVLCSLALPGCMAGPEDHEVDAGMSEDGEIQVRVDAPTEITYQRQRGYYRKAGDWVDFHFELVFSNDSGVEIDRALLIVPPFQPEEEATDDGIVFPWVGRASATLGVYPPEQYTTVELVLSSHANARIAVQGNETSTDSTINTVRLGDGDLRVIVGSIGYRTSGVQNY